MKTLLKALAIAGAATWVYWPCLQGTWLWDDGLEIVQNAALRSPDGWWQPWLHPEGLDYFPLKGSLQWLEWQVWGPNPLGYHLVSLGLHIASALLLWRLLRVLGAGAAWVGGLLFAVHPLAVESVAWISEFKNTVSLPPLLLASLAYVAFDRSGAGGARLRSLLWFAASLAGKTSTVMFPFVLLLFAWWRHGRLRARDLRSAAPFFALALAMGAATLWFQSTRAIGVAGTPQPVGLRISEAGWSLLAYARLALWPYPLAPIYPPAGSPWPGLVAWLAVAAVLGLFWSQRVGWGRHALLGAGWFVLNLLPVLGIIPMAYLRIAPRADHFAYLPLVGLVGLAAAAYGRLLDRATTAPHRPRAVLPVAGAAAAVIAVLALSGRGDAAAFTDEKALWTRAVERNPGAWLARNNLGRVFLQEHHPAEAAEELREAVRLQPDSAEAHANLGDALEALGRPDAARAEYGAALGIDPRFAGGHYDLGLSYLRAGKPAEAAGEFREALRYDPRHASAHNNLGLVLAGEGRVAEAMDEYRGALALNPGMPEAHLNLGNALFRLGRAEEAVGEYREALRQYPEYSGAHHNLGLALSSLGRPSEAEAEFALARATANR